MGRSEGQVSEGDQVNDEEVRAALHRMHRDVHSWARVGRLLDVSRGYVYGVAKYGWAVPGWMHNKVTLYFSHDGPMRAVRRAIWARATQPLPDGVMILGEARQCPECVIEMENGNMLEHQTWYVFPYDSQLYCSKTHRRRAKRRRKAERAAP